LKTENDSVTSRSATAFDAGLPISTMLVDDLFDSEYGIFPEPKTPIGVETRSRAPSRIRALCGLAAASAWMILAAVIDVLQRA
jgi:hypothetical protein